jgi:hypothetical protein
MIEPSREHVHALRVHRVILEVGGYGRPEGTRRQGNTAATTLRRVRPLGPVKVHLTNVEQRPTLSKERAKQG